MMSSLDEQMEELNGPLPRFSEQKKGEHITYRVGTSTVSGTVVWVCGPGNVAGKHIPTHYIVERDGALNSFPDSVWQSDIIVDPRH